MIPARKEDILVEELWDLRELYDKQEDQLYKTKMAEMMNVEIAPDTTYKDGIVIECSSIPGSKSINMSIMSIDGTVLFNEFIKPYISDWDDREYGVWGLADPRLYPHEIYEEVKAIINGTDCIIVYDKSILEKAMMRWGLSSSKVLDLDENDVFANFNDEYDNHFKIVDISEEFAIIYGEGEKGVGGYPIPQSLYTCYRYYMGNMLEVPTRNTELSLHRCDAIRKCYLAMEKQKKEKQKDNKSNLDAVVLSGFVATDTHGKPKVAHIFVRDMNEKLLFDYSFDSDSPKKRRGDNDELSKILGKAKCVVSYDEMVIEAVRIICKVELHDDKIICISDWFARVYGEIEPYQCSYKKQSLYTCARTLGYDRYQELHLRDYKCESQAISYCYKIKQAFEKIQ